MRLEVEGIRGRWSESNPQISQDRQRFSQQGIISPSPVARSIERSRVVEAEQASKKGSPMRSSSLRPIG